MNLMPCVVGRIVPSIIEVSICGLISLSFLFLLVSSADNQDIMLISINIGLRQTGATTNESTH